MATVELPERSQAPPRAVPHFAWRRLTIACLLLVVSGGIRYLRDRQFATLSKGSETSPFPIAEFPTEIGTWRAKPGSEQSLEPEIARIAGASDHLIRTYIDSKTGATADVMILYGLATAAVWAHTPEACYPAGGMPARSEADLVSVPIPSSPGQNATFRRQLFGKGNDIREVYHSFNHAGEWGVDMGSHWKTFRYHPGMFKIQVQHPFSGDTGGRDVEDLLGQLVDVIEKHKAPGS